MPSAFQLYRIRNTEFKDVSSNAEVARQLAMRFGMSESGLRGTLTKIDTIENKIKLSRCLIDTDPIDPSVANQREIVSMSESLFGDMQAIWSTYDRPTVGVFISDKHSPYHRHDAWELTIKIIDDLPHVDVVSVQNDWADYRGWSLRWVDGRRARDRIWSDDIEYQDRLEEHDYETIRMACP